MASRQSENKILTEVMARCNKNSCDEKLINAVAKDMYLDVERILLNHKEKCSQDALNGSLMLAAKCGHKHNLINLLKAGADPNWTNKDRNTSLMVCAQRGYLEMVRILIKKGANVNMQSKSGDTGLMLSMRKSGATEMVRLLCTPENVDIKNSQGYTALMKAVETGDLNTIQMLIFNGASASEIRDGESVKDMANQKGLLTFLNFFCECKVSHQPTICAAVRYRNSSMIETLLMLENNRAELRSSDGKSALEILLDLVIAENKGLSSVDKDIIKLLIDNGVEVNVKTLRRSKLHKRKKSDSPLLKAVQIGDIDVVRWLCSKGARVDDTFEQQTPLMIAAKQGFSEIARYLVSVKADTDFTNDEGTALDLAVKYQQLECAKIILEVMAIKDVMKACQKAIEYSELCLIEHLCERFTIDVKNDSRLIEWAIISRSRDILIFLLSKGADVGATMTKTYHVTFHSVATFIYPLHLCVMLGNLDFVEVLLHFNASIDIVDSNGDTPLVHACASTDSRMVELLLQRGANVNVTNEWGETPIFTAVESDVLKNVRLLLQWGAVHDIFNNAQQTPLSIAIRRGSLEIVTMLIEMGVDTDAIMNGGDSYLTLLLKSLSYNYDIDYVEAIITSLLEQNLDIDRLDNDNNTALILACKSEVYSPSIIRLLLRHGADVSIVNDYNETALSVAFHKGNLEIAKWLLENKASFHLAIQCQEAVHLFILKNDANSLKLALGQGVYPHLGSSRGHLFYNEYEKYGIKNVSPLLRALLEKRFSIAAYLIENRFLTKFDVTAILGMDCFQKTLQKREQGKLFNNLLSLTTLSFAHISDSLGATPDREKKVSLLPIPNKFKEQLLFRNLTFRDEDF